MGDTETKERDMSKWKSALPTWKWWTQLVGSIGTILTMALTGDGVNTDDEKRAVIGICVTLALTYIAKNEDTPGGIPTEGGK
jgi:hypothetical protein